VKGVLDAGRISPLLDVAADESIENLVALRARKLSLDAIVSVRPTAQPRGDGPISAALILGFGSTVTVMLDLSD